jgi:hypothetical protein
MLAYPIKLHGLSTEYKGTFQTAYNSDMIWKPTIEASRELTI